MAKIRNGTETWFAYDESGRLLGSNVVSAKDKGQQEIIWLDDLPVGALQGKTLYPIEADHLGSPRKVIDPASNQAIWDWPILDNPFGETQPNQNPDGNAQTYTLNLRFPGQQYDPETGLYYNYFRDYEPGTGRYVESDPIGISDGSNTFSFVKSNPIYSYDPFGLTTYTGFPRDKQKQMEEAVRQASETLRKCKGCTDCGSQNQYSSYCISDYEKEQVLQGLESADFVYNPRAPETSSGEALCGLHVNGTFVKIFPGALAGKCCPLAVVLAHEAGHISGLDHRQIGYYEQQCFGCRNTFGVSE